MQKHLVITITSPDRPGIVERITNVVVSHGGNWEESRMAHLGGDFAGIIKVAVPEDAANALESTLRSLADHEMAVLVKTTQPIQTDESVVGASLRLRLSGADHEGIVHDVAAYLARCGINVEAMETKVAPAPITAVPLFEMTAELTMPSGIALEELESDLDRLGEELTVNIEIDREAG